MNAAEKDEVAAEARSFINTRAFTLLFADLEENYVTQLKSANVGDLSASTAHASLRVLEDVKAQLGLYSKGRF